MKKKVLPFHLLSKGTIFTVSGDLHSSEKDTFVKVANSHSVHTQTKADAIFSRDDKCIVQGWMQYAERKELSPYAE